MRPKRSLPSGEEIPENANQVTYDFEDAINIHGASVSSTLLTHYDQVLCIGERQIPPVDVFRRIGARVHPLRHRQQGSGARQHGGSAHRAIAAAPSRHAHRCPAPPPIPLEEILEVSRVTIEVAEGL